MTSKQTIALRVVKARLVMFKRVRDRTRDPSLSIGARARNSLLQPCRSKKRLWKRINESARIEPRIAKVVMKMKVTHAMFKQVQGRIRGLSLSTEARVRNSLLPLNRSKKRLLRKIWKSARTEKRDRVSINLSREARPSITQAKHWTTRKMKILLRGKRKMILN